MECPRLDDSVDRIWTCLLDFKEWNKNAGSGPDTQSVFLCQTGTQCDSNVWKFAATPNTAADICPNGIIVVYLPGSVVHKADRISDPLPGCPSLLTFDISALSTGQSPWTYLRGPHQPSNLLTAFRFYLPYLIGHHMALQRRAPWVSGHLAQTLDGRIATRDGHSQWISNRANRKHSHRLRALHDAVLVGRGTVENDDPLLTVRDVPGSNPGRVILDRECCLLAKDKPYRIFTEQGRNWVLHSDCITKVDQTNAAEHNTTTVAVREIEDASGFRVMDPEAILEAVWREGICSVFIEGGSRTLSHFLGAHRIDLLHLHMAPVLLGSGIPSFTLPAVARIQDGISFHMNHFCLDQEILLECVPLRKRQ